MWRRRAEPLQMAPGVNSPTGNVRLTVPAPRVAGDDLVPTTEQAVPRATVVPADDGASPLATAPPAPVDGGAPTAAGWSIRDGDGTIVEAGLSSRAEALRTIGLVAMRGRCAPYEVLDPTGRPTGDRLS